MSQPLSFQNPLPRSARCRLMERSSISRVGGATRHLLGWDNLKHLETMMGGNHKPTLETNIKHPQTQDCDWLELFSQLGVEPKIMGGIPPEQKAKELHQLWENEEMIRFRFREQGSLLTWADPKLVGVPCMANISVNSRVLIIFAEYFCPLQSGPKSPHVGFLRSQVRSAQTLLFKYQQVV